ncbi:MAG: acyltransferase [Bacteroidales bacterium]|nr:acyltransferase [Bacteroidales bacterium]
MKFLSASKLNFEDQALALFYDQSARIETYKQFIKYLKIDPKTISKIEDIPFLPIELFKTHTVFDRNKSNKICFTSSGTSGMSSSKHYVADLEIYKASFLNAFQIFFGPPKDYCFIALLPSYLEREGSSLIYMVDALMQASSHPENGYYLRDYEALTNKLQQLEDKHQKTILWGVSYALLDLIAFKQLNLKHTLVIETGGMKGTRQEMTKEDFHQRLKQGLGVNTICSEYGMTELLSQAYSKGHGFYDCPPWMRILIRDVNDPKAFLKEGQTGGINIIDLANIDSCAFIATQDLGKFNADESFSVLGRFDNADVRGCNLLVQ